MGQLRVVGAQEPADIRERVFLGGHRAAVGVTEHLPGDVDSRRIFEAGFAALDKVRVLREAAGVDVKRYTCLARDAADLADIGHRNGLAAPGIVRDGDHDQGDVLGPVPSDDLGQRRRVHVALEREIRIQVCGFGTRQIECLAPVVLDIGPCRVEVRVVRDDGAWLHHHAEQDVFGGASLVRRDYLFETENVLDRVPEPEPAARAGVGLIAAHQRRPGL